MDVDAFIQRTNSRTLPEGYRGPLYLWDIDKTYLDTHFSSVRGLLRIPLEMAVDKRAIPGTIPLLRALRRGTTRSPALHPLYFVSGSPPQLRSVIERKMTLDGVDFDGVTFKDQWGFVRAGRPKGVKEQVGYKLRALLLYRQELPAGCKWSLFGDDVESDAEAFALFGEVCAGLRGAALETTLRKLGVHPDDAERCVALADTVEVTDDPVEGIYIHLSRGREPSSFTNPKVKATRSFIQTALVLAHRGHIVPSAVSAVAEDLRRTGLIKERELEAHLDDAGIRLEIPAELTDLARRR